MATEKNEEVYHYYCVKEDSERGKLLREFITKGKEAAQRTSDLAKKLGAVSYTESPDAVFPGVGIGSLIFNKAQSKRKYKRIGRSGNFYECIPMSNTKQGQEVLREILNIKPVLARDLRLAFGLDDKETKAPAWLELVGWFYIKSAVQLDDSFEASSEGTFNAASKQLAWMELENQK